jgi:hypothetical protein
MGSQPQPRCYTSPSGTSKPPSTIRSISHQIRATYGLVEREADLDVVLEAAHAEVAGAEVAALAGDDLRMVGRGRRRYLTSESSLNIGRYIEMMITPTISPTPIIISGSMIEVRDWTAASTSSS